MRSIVRWVAGRLPAGGAHQDLVRAVTRQSLLLGRMLSVQLRGERVQPSFSAVEFSVFSQFGDDGIIQYLTRALEIPVRTFVEFGVEDYTESTTRFLLSSDNWSGLVMDGDAGSIASLQRSELFWRHDLQAVAAFVEPDNVNELIASHGTRGEIGLLHVDIDGMDYWVWKAISVINPVITVVEYNSVFGCERAVTLPYSRDFSRTRAHHSNLYWGASLPALCQLAEEKGCCFVGCNTAGNNAYFVRRDRLGPLRPLTAREGYVASHFRESRDRQGRLTFLRGSDRLAALRGMPVWDLDANAPGVLE